jgi:hypothetical protein
MHKLWCRQQFTARRALTGQEIPASKADGPCHQSTVAIRPRAPVSATFDETQKLQRKDFSALRLPATLSLHVKRSPPQVIQFLTSLPLVVSLCGFDSMTNSGDFLGTERIGFWGAAHPTYPLIL